MLQKFNEYFDKNNLRKAESLWLAGVHAVALIALGHLLIHRELFFKWLVIMSIFHYLYGLGITGGSHRLWAHKSYTAATPLRIFLMFLNSGANQGSIYHWSRDHRLHHKFSDTDLDPHTINKGFFFAHVGWLLKKKSPELVAEGKKINLEDLHRDPVVMFQKKYYHQLAVLFCFLIPSIVYCIVLPTSFFIAYTYAALGYVLLLNATWCVNSVCHLFGSRTWNSKINPTDNFFVAAVTMGEGWHNWHHEYPGDWKASKDLWYMWNPTARFIEINKMLGLASTK